MGTVDLSLPEPVVSEITAVLVELARLSQHAGSANGESRVAQPAGVD